MHITKVEGNFKKLVPTELGRFTFLVGPHASGKSSVIQAIWLAWQDDLWDKTDARQLYSSAAKLRSRGSRTPELLSIRLDTTLGPISYTISGQKRRQLSDRLAVIQENPAAWAACLPRIAAPLSGKAALSNLLSTFGDSAGWSAAELVDSWFNNGHGAGVPELLTEALNAQEAEDMASLLLGALAHLTAFKNVTAGRGAAKLERQLETLLSQMGAFQDGEEARLQAVLDADRLSAATQGGCCPMCKRDGFDPPPRLTPAELDALKDMLAVQRDAARARRDYEAVQVELAALRRAQAEARGLEAELRSRIADLASMAVGAAVESASRFMPRGLCPTIVIEDGSAFWGVGADGGLAVFEGMMSGMEESALRIAKMCAESAAAPARIVLLDDDEMAGIRASARDSMLGSLRRMVSEGKIDQVIIATTEDCAYEPDDTVVRMGA